MITKEEFTDAISEFRNVEESGSYYDIAVNLFKNGYEIEAYILILATWNIARFRLVVLEFNIVKFKKTIEDLNPIFNNLEHEEFRSINFDNYKEDIEKIYNTLSSIKGIDYTGASKIMHLKNRNVFVLWDGYIRGEKNKKYYEQLEIVKSGKRKIKEYGKSAQNYIQFLKDMQELFSNIDFQDANKTFAKAIDEYNYINITPPIQEMEKQQKENKRNNRA